jgi:hypothetical protein
MAGRDEERRGALAGRDATPGRRRGARRDRPRARAATAATLLWLCACREQPRPWEGNDDDAATAPARVPRPVDIDAGESLLRDASTLLEAAEDAGPPPPPVRVGGPWVRCYGNFRPGDEPLRDVTRLGVLCGPANGMSRVEGPAMQGTVAEGNPTAAGTLRASRGECLRVFAVADPGVTDLDVVVRSSRGAAVGADHSEDRFPIVQPDRPLCFLDDDELTIEVSARGRGRFAAEAWRLRVDAGAPREADPAPPAASAGGSGPPSLPDGP